MMSTESQPQQATTYDERIFNDRIRQLFDPTDSTSLLSPEKNIGHMTSIVDALFPEQVSLHHHHQQQQHLREQRRSSTNDLTTASDRFPLWNTNKTSSASAFCGGMTNSSSAFANRRQSTLNSSSRSLRNAHHRNPQQQPSNYRPPPVTRPRFTASSIRLPSAAIITASSTNHSNAFPRSTSSLSTTNGSSNVSTEYQPRFASRLSSTRLPSAAGPVGSHDQIAATIDPIAPSSSLVGIMSGHPPSASAVLSRSTSSTNAQSQQFVTMTQTTTTTFCYVPASASLAYQNLAGTGRSTTVPHH